jgi:hypothetical protein
MYHTSAICLNYVNCYDEMSPELLLSIEILN